MRSFIAFCMFILLFSAFIFSKNLTRNRTEHTAESLQNTYRNDNNALSIALENCSRWKQQSCNLDGKCDGAFLSYATMSKSASCIAAETIAQEKNIILKGGNI